MSEPVPPHPAEHERVVRFMNIQLHNSNQATNSFWDIVAILIQTYEVRCVGGDFNTAAIVAVPELRRRGCLVNTGGWYPFIGTEEKEICVDSMLATNAL